MLYNSNMRGDSLNETLLKWKLKHFSPIRTERLTVRKMRVSDALSMDEYATLPIVSEYLLWTPHLNLAETQGHIEFICARYEKGLVGDWGVCLRDSDRLIGTCGYAGIDTKKSELEIGYVMSPEYWGKGYMTEALDAVLKYTFCTLGAKAAVVRIMQGNERSVRLAERVGFVYDYTVENELFVKGVHRTILHYRLTRQRYFELKK